MSGGQLPRGAGAAVLLALAAALTIAACDVAPSPPLMPHILTSHLDLLEPAVDFSDPADCAGTGEWADIRSGADVTVYSPAGGVVGTARLSKGEAMGPIKHCQFTIRVGSLPRLPVYTVKIGAREERWPIDFADLDGFVTIMMP